RKLHSTQIECKQGRFYGRARLDDRNVRRVFQRAAHPGPVRSKQSESVVASIPNNRERQRSARLQRNLCESGARTAPVPEGSQLPLLRSQQGIRFESECVGGSGTRPVWYGRGLLQRLPLPANTAGESCRRTDLPDRGKGKLQYPGRIRQHL